MNDKGAKMVKICAIGINIPGLPSLDILQPQSLDDYDVIFFNPEQITSKLSHAKQLNFVNGNTTLNEQESAKAITYFSHWTSEIAFALDVGKTIVVTASLNSLIKYAHRSSPNTNTWVTNASTLYEPFGLSELNTTSLQGEIVSATPSCIQNILSPLAKHLSYSVVFNDIRKLENTQPVLTTTGGRCVGLLKLFNEKKGKILIIPKPIFDYDPFDDTEKDAQLGKILTQTAVDLHKFGIQACEALPEWVNDELYKTETEKMLDSQLTDIDTQIQRLKDSKLPIEQQKEEEMVLKQLLFGKGKPLENAVNTALNIIGISAKSYRFTKKDLEIDQLANVGDRILIGECEGKDNKDIDKTKISQLIINKGEYYAEPDVDTSKQIKLVLFGNPMRLTVPKDRTLDFTKACKDIANNNQVALVKTEDLFYVAKYIKASGDKKFATTCLNTIMDTEQGIVKFPDVPRSKKQ